MIIATSILNSLLDHTLSFGLGFVGASSHEREAVEETSDQGNVCSVTQIQLVGIHAPQETLNTRIGRSSNGQV